MPERHVLVVWSHRWACCTLCVCTSHITYHMHDARKRTKTKEKGAMRSRSRLKGDSDSDRRPCRLPCVCVVHVKRPRAHLRFVSAAVRVYTYYILHSIHIRHVPRDTRTKPDTCTCTQHTGLMATHNTTTNTSIRIPYTYASITIQLYT